MWTQRDQLQAYQFLRRRLVSALVVGDANHPVSPSRRVVIGCAVGAGAALLVAAGFGIYGLLRPGANSDWRNPGQVVIEKDTGASYVMGTDGLLHPMLNYASARLLAGGDGTATVRVSSRSVAAAPRGVPLGIAGAPSSLPPKDRLLRGGFTVCVQAAAGRPAGTAPTTTATLGLTEPGTPVDPAAALIVSDPEGTRHAVVAGRRHRIADEITAVALGYDAVRPLPVSSAWLGALVAGPNLSLRTVTGVGTPGPPVGGRATRVGQVLAVSSVGRPERYYLVLPGGLAAITATEAALVLGNPANRVAYPGGAAVALAVSAADVAGLPPVENPAGAGSGTASNAYPASLAAPVDVGAAQAGLGGAPVAACVVPGADQAVVRLARSPGLPAGAQPAAGAGGVGADAVFVPAGRAAVLREQPVPGATLGTVYLLTDQGVRHAVPTGEALSALGYGGVGPVPVPANVLALFPTGPVLDPVAASRPAAPADQVAPVGGTR